MNDARSHDLRKVFAMFRRTLLLLLTLGAVAAAQDKKDDEPKKDEPPAKEVKLRWYGQSMFQLETANRFRIVFDPHAIPQFGRALLRADFVIISHPHNDHDQVEALDTKVKESDIYRGVVVGKGGKQEWKAVDEKRGQIRLRNIGTFHDAVNGTQRGKNSIWIVEVDGLTFCHLGDLGHELSEQQVKAIGKVDVLMVPIGGIYTINGEQAKKVVKQIKPRLYVVPMHYGVPGYEDLLGPDEFLEGEKNIKRMLMTNELVIPLEMKADAAAIVLLGWEKKKEEPKKQ
jgi:L-ascorbate metabolism protein UlaG (beta-lactamase superfamily)